MGWLSSILPAAGALVGSLGGPVGAAIGYGIGSGFQNKDAARKQNDMSNFQAMRQEDFQRQMSNSAYQRSTKDLEKAGLNRILALGSPASTPTGQQAPVVTEKQDMDAAMPAVTTALAQKQTVSNIAQQSAQADLATAKTAQSRAETIRTLRTQGIDKLKNRAGNAANDAITRISQMLSTSAKEESTHERAVRKQSDKNRKKYFPTPSERAQKQKTRSNYKPKHGEF